MCWCSSASTALRVAAGSRRATALSSAAVVLHAVDLRERARSRPRRVDQVGDACERVDERVLLARAAQRRSSERSDCSR